LSEEDSTYLIASANGLNALGYQLIGSGDTEEAVVALKLQTDTYPWMANAWDSMGEGYMANGDDDLAIEAFQTSLTLNPAQNVMDNSISLLGQLGFDYVAPEFVDLSERDLLGLSGTYENAQNSPATITVVTVEDGTLKAQQPGQPEFDLLPQSETLFWASSAGSRAGVTVEFVKGDSGVAAEMLFTFPNSATPVTALRQSESGTN
jgi:tetratricopeptide (TPR) repeat protein